MKKLNRNEGIAVFVALAVIIIFPILSLQFSAVDTLFGQNTENQSAVATEAGTPFNELVVQDLVVGDGEEAVKGTRVTVHYIGQLMDGTVFDSSVDSEPFTFDLGIGQVIPGWEQGIVGMKVGGKRILLIPPQLGYGSQGIGPIPGNATLLFEVELLEVN